MESKTPQNKVTCLENVVRNSISRRSILKGGAFLGLQAFVINSKVAPIFAEGSSESSVLNFEQVTANSLDTITLPKDFLWEPLISWGDPLWSKSLLNDLNDCGTSESQLLSFGDNNDGMKFFSKDGINLLVVNNEYSNLRYLCHNRKNKFPETTDDIKKSKAAHGISIIEIKIEKGKWTYVKDSRFNRRITADSKMEISGPAKGSEHVKTIFDPEGKESLGTWANCGCGKTPWGTYLTCEENFDAYFSASDKKSITEDMKRYGFKEKDKGYNWSKIDERFDVTKHPNETNRIGYVVEFDPFDPNSIPKKRTALGRFKHENAEIVISKDNSVVVYMGDDERGEFLYKFVSAKNMRLMETIARF